MPPPAHDTHPEWHADHRPTTAAVDRHLVKALALLASLLTVLNLVRHHDPSVVTWALRLHVDPDNRFLRDVLAAIFNPDARHLFLVGLGTGPYAVLYAVEGLRLWFEQKWAEYHPQAPAAGRCREKVTAEVVMEATRCLAAVR